MSGIVESLIIDAYQTCILTVMHDKHEHCSNTFTTIGGHVSVFLCYSVCRCIYESVLSFVPFDQLCVFVSGIFTVIEKVCMQAENVRLSSSLLS